MANNQNKPFNPQASKRLKMGFFKHKFVYLSNIILNHVQSDHIYH